MLQQITISTSNAERFKALLETALERETRLQAYAIQRTRERLAEFEKRFELTTAEFKRKFSTRQLEENLDFIEWWGEIQTLRLLEEKKQTLESA